MTVLNKDTLVLNKNWVPIGTTSVKNAIILMSRGRALGMCPESFVAYRWEDWISEETNLPSATNYIKTSNCAVPAPDSIILTKYDSLSKTKVTFSRRAVYQRDSFICQYCLKRKKTVELSLDHVIPKSKNGETNWENCVTSCKRCNNKKGDKTLKELGMKLPRKPRRPSWNPVMHIAPERRPASWAAFLKEEW